MHMKIIANTISKVYAKNKYKQSQNLKLYMGNSSQGSETSLKLCPITEFRKIMSYSGGWKCPEIMSNIICFLLVFS